MSVNNYKPHVFVLPEDDANSAKANGFALEVRQPRNIQVLSPAGGWTNVRDAIASQHEKGLRMYPNRHLVLLLDFDDDLDRGVRIHDRVSNDFKSRVFVVGAKTEPEELRQARLGTFEEIGRRLAVECRDGAGPLSTHELLKHNQAELARLRAAVFAIVF